jgi:hypothetical protein
LNKYRGKKGDQQFGQILVRNGRLEAGLEIKRKKEKVKIIGNK